MAGLPFIVGVAAKLEPAAGIAVWLVVGLGVLGDELVEEDLGRNYIGSEISAEYCEIAESRLAQGVLDLFTESVVEPVELGEE
jgi:hypothetical protein